MKFFYILTILTVLLLSCSEDTVNKSKNLVAPTITPAGGTIDISQTVSITSTSSGDIYFNTSGKTPTRMDTKYTQPFTLQEGTFTVTAALYSDGGWSASTSKTFTVTKQQQTDSLSIHFKKPESWNSSVNLYYWETTPITDSIEWPGVAMISDGDDWYSYTIENVKSASIIFNDGANQTDDLTRDKNGWYYKNVWYDSKPNEGGLCDGVACGNNAACNSTDGVCYCNSGYEGDPNSGCTLIVTNLCENVTCGNNAACNSTDGVCYCNSGYEGDPNSGCTLIVTTCDPTCGINAYCNSETVCVCNSGYEGVPEIGCTPIQLGGDKPYSTNPTLGKHITTPIIIDGVNTNNEWSDDMLIALDMAGDDPRTLGGNWTMHETPWDLTHLWAAWDDSYLYLAWQYVDVTDVIDPSNAGSSAGTKPIQMNLIQWIAIDTVPNQGASLDVWGKNGGEPYWTGSTLPDYQIYIGSNLTQGYISKAIDGVFAVDDGDINYHKFVTSGGYNFEQQQITNLQYLVTGMEINASISFGGASLWGVKDCDHALESPIDESKVVNFLELNHNKNRDIFYEIKIPLTQLGLTRDQLESNGLGVMLGQGEFSCMDTIPNDPATTDTAGTTDSNSSREWEDIDSLTVPFARVGSL
ncbi:starch-binding protein [bacterium]|nr:starch-binding protein [bacterium]